ncbi:MAG: hypothetical protein JWO73_471 [Candidatus Taylorbacteria bacterium]|nr:hypothetical protein [Candidatus Taylorbacteria bacterium]
MTKNGKIALGIVVLIIIVIAFVSMSGNKETGPIRIGFVGPLSGDAANIGQNAKAAVEIATAEVNAAGGINGRQLEVMYEDGKCGGTAASSAANKLINVDKVSVILGGACSGETMAFAQAAEQSRTPVLSYCSSVPTLTKAGDYIFRNYPSDSFQGKFGADHLFNTLGKKKVAVLYVKSDWGIGINDVFIQEFKKLGGTVAVDDGYDQNTHDLRTILTKVKAANVDALYFLGYSNETVVALSQAKDVGLKTTWFGGDGWDDPKIWSSAGKVAEGSMYSRVTSNPTDAFRTAMKAKTASDEIAGCSATAYDGTKIIAKVIGSVGTDKTSIKNELYKTVYTSGVSSKEISFDENGDLKTANYEVAVIRDGKAVVSK